MTLVFTDFCQECGQPIKLGENGAWYHSTADTYPFLNEHEPVFIYCDSNVAHNALPNNQKG